MDKRLLLSSFLIVLFTAYVVVQHDNVAVPVYNSGKNPIYSPVVSPGNSNTSPVVPPGAPSSSPNVSASPPPIIVINPPSPPPIAVPSQKYKDGQYTGSVQDAYYGSVQVEATIQSGIITAVDFLQYPNTHRTSVMINSQAMPLLQSEAIQAQSAKVDIVSGATFTSQAYQASLADALSQAMG
jgi:uncharacterized protein with FMN-binding domain